MHRRCVSALVAVSVVAAGFLSLAPAARSQQRLAPSERSGQVLGGLAHPEDGIDLGSEPAAASTLAGSLRAWRFECADCPRHPHSMTDRSLRLDGDGHPHVAYGGKNLYYAWHDGLTWHFETVDSTLDVGGYPALALDAGENAHISYCDERAEDLRYARRTPTGWQVETVDSAGQVGQYSSLALDSAGYPYISYYDASHEHLRVAHWTGVEWSIQTADDAAGAGRHTSLALDGDGHPHVSYVYHYCYSYGRDWVCADNLRYALWTGSAWDIQTVDSGKATKEHTSLALDGDGRPHISYYADCFYDGYVYDCEQKLKYASWTGSQWLLEDVDDPGEPGRYSSLALDGDDNPHIAYQRSDGLRYAAWTGSAWVVQTVDSQGYERSFSSLALDAGGRAHIVYYHSGSSDWLLRYARWDGARWMVETADEERHVGRSPSLALDASGAPRISYYDASHDDLLYAWRSGTTWESQVVDSTGDVGYYTSMRLDSQGRPHIAYRDVSGWTLKYARWTGQTWEIHTVDDRDYVGEYPALALDSAGNPHISYNGFQFGPSQHHDLRYARWTGGSWDVQTVDSTAVQVGYQSALAVDVAGRPHIAYHAIDGLRYAQWTGSAWQIQAVDDAGSDPSLALDRAGQPHISYFYDAHPNYGLRYASWSGSDWRIETIDEWGEDTSLALDAADRPHIAYIYAGLRYAYWDGSSWQLQAVDATSAAYYEGPSLALDACGEPHIACHANGDLVYAAPAPPLGLLKEAAPRQGLGSGDLVTFTLTLRGAGAQVRLWDPLPASLVYVAGSASSAIGPPPVYSDTLQALEWQGRLPEDGAQTLRFAAQVTGGLPIVNTAWLTDTQYGRSVVGNAILNPVELFLPLLRR